MRFRLHSCFQSLLSKWTIRRQLLLFTVFAILVILALINGLVVFNFYYVKNNTVQEVHNTAFRQADENLKTLTKLAAKTVSISELADLTVLHYFQEFLANMYEEDTFALSIGQGFSNEYAHLPQSCMQLNTTRYGSHPVCMRYSSVRCYGSRHSMLMAMTSRFDDILPKLPSLAEVDMFRVLMYFEEEDFVRIFPGCYIPQDYHPKDTVWYQTAEMIGTPAPNAVSL